MDPFASEAAMFDFLASKGFTYSRVMLIMPNILGDGGFANYKAYDGQLFLTHMQMWQSKGFRTILALRDYEYYTVPERAAILIDIYQKCRLAGLNPVLTLGNEPGNSVPLPSGQRYTTAEFRQCADLVIPTLQTLYSGTFEWWATGTADLNDFNRYMAALGPWIPTRRSCHTYDGAVTDGSLPLAQEVDRSLANLSDVNSAPWVMEEWTPYSHQYPQKSPEWNAERLRQFKGVMDNNCDLYIFWSANTNPRICDTPTRLATWVEEALAYRPMQNPDPDPFTLRINCGGPAYTDVQGNYWSADQAYASGGYGYVGGSPYVTSNAIADTADDTLYQSERWGLSSYLFTIPPGEYEVTLHFAEIFYDGITKGGAGTRVFDVTMEQWLVLNNLDLYSLVGYSKAHLETFNCQVTDGLLNIGFSPSADHAKISAIEIRQLVNLPSTVRRNAWDSYR